MIVRRTATGAVGLGALLTVVLGGVFASFAVYVLDEEPVWASIQGVCGVLCILAGIASLVQVARDLAHGSLSSRGERWAWTATAALSLLFFASVWFFYVGVVCPFLTLFAVRWARGPLGSRSR